jgi:4-carboxymuconolactone decarboxylase
MADQKPSVSNSFQSFLTNAPKHSEAWMTAVQKLDNASVLDKKNEELAYPSVLAAMRLDSGVPFQIQMAKKPGAFR